MPTSSAIPARWKAFVKAYSLDHAYWYQPKGLAISADEVRSRLEVLAAFEGKKWRATQSAYVKRLAAQGISAARSSWSEGGAPLARMLKQVFVTLGLAWTDADDRIEISQIGKNFIAATGADAESILSLQALKYQFWNPCVGRKKPHGAVMLHPVPFLFQMLNMMNDPVISNVEYNLFASKAKRPGDVERVYDQIMDFRTLTVEQQRLIVDACKSYMIGGSKRSSIYNTIKLNRSYAFKMWSLSGLLYSNEGIGIGLDRSKNRGATKNYLDRYASEATYITFASAKEFFSWMGNPGSKPDKQTALEVYVNRGDIESAMRTKAEIGESNTGD